MKDSNRGHHAPTVRSTRFPKRKRFPPLTTQRPKKILSRTLHPTNQATPSSCSARQRRFASCRQKRKAETLVGGLSAYLPNRELGVSHPGNEVRKSCSPVGKTSPGPQRKGDVNQVEWDKGIGVGVVRSQLGKSRREPLNISAAASSGDVRFVNTPPFSTAWPLPHRANSKRVGGEADYREEGWFTEENCDRFQDGPL